MCMYGKKENSDKHNQISLSYEPLINNKFHKIKNKNVKQFGDSLNNDEALGNFQS